ncbi:MAG: uracil-xanthine permease [Clostridia bacterium]|nr:uracil-xanthine permease [Clostridia bacterium]
MQLYYKPSDKPGLWKTIVFALQQVLAILAATIVVPVIINGSEGSNMSQSAALFGAGAGTLVYLLFTKFKSPVFLGSSFAFIGSMCAAFAGATSMAVGYLGLIIGAIFAGLVYVVIALVVKKVGTGWIDKVMPAAVIGPTVAVIGLSLAGNAVGDLSKGSVMKSVMELVVKDGKLASVTSSVPVASPYVALICGLVTLFVTIACSVYGKKMLKMIPFIIGIVAGYAVATVFTVIGLVAEVPALQVINFGLFKDMQWLPEFTFVKAFDGFKDLSGFGAYLGTLAVAYIPVAFVVFAEHLADHKNISSIIEEDLLKDPGLHRTLLGDGVGSMVGAFFGGCPNTTYGESVGCVAISGNASVVTIVAAAIICIVASFFAPFITFLATIPSCVMGGVCFALYGFIAVSGLKMIQKVDLEDNRNLFVVSVILIAGVGNLVVNFGEVTLTSVACALILGMVTNLLTHIKCKCAKCEQSAESVEVPAEEKQSEVVEEKQETVEETSSEE